MRRVVAPDPSVPVAVACSLCGASTSSLVNEGRDYWVLDGESPMFAVRYCDHCAIGFSTPPLDDAALAPYYPPTYEPYAEKSSIGPLLQRLKYMGDLRRIRKAVTGRTLFEIGGGNGAFLGLAKRMGFSVSGIEPSADGCATARRVFGVELQQGLVHQIRYHQTYDVIVARHVLEHVNDIRSCLERILREGLKPGGILFIKVPRLDSWEAKVLGRYWSGYDLPRHRWHFSGDGLKRLLSDVGFTQVRVAPEVVPSDLSRSLEYLGKHGHQNPWRALLRSYARLPKSVKLVLAEVVALPLAAFGAGRMVAIASRPE